MEIMMKKFFVPALVQLLVFGVLGAFLLMGATMALLTFAFWHENPSIDLFREMGEILLMAVPYVRSRQVLADAEFDADAVKL